MDVLEYLLSLPGLIVLAFIGVTGVAFYRAAHYPLCTKDPPLWLREVEPPVRPPWIGPFLSPEAPPTCRQCRQLLGLSGGSAEGPDGN